jgi:hypothetical protein
LYYPLRYTSQATCLLQLPSGESDDQVEKKRLGLNWPCHFIAKGKNEEWFYGKKNKTN